MIILNILENYIKRISQSQHCENTVTLSLCGHTADYEMGFGSVLKINRLWFWGIRIERELNGYLVSEFG